MVVQRRRPFIIKFVPTIAPLLTIMMMMVLFLLLLSSSTTCNALSSSLEPTTTAFTTASGKPVSRYGLGGAARSIQPSSLPSLYYEETIATGTKNNATAAPFYFYYNPHRYPKFMNGIKQVCAKHNRADIFVASGGTDRSPTSLDQRLQDCLKYCGGKYLDLFILEYICPNEMIEEDQEDDDETSSFENSIMKIMKPGQELTIALKHVQNWVKQGSVRYVGISTHSHVVGKDLAYCNEVDILMLRYGMSHKDAAENLSFPAAKSNNNNKPIIAFTSTRWNSLLQNGISEGNIKVAPTSADCLSFVFGSSSSTSTSVSSLSFPIVEAVLHSARDEDELLSSMKGLRLLSQEEILKWREYGQIFEDANDDYFDEYPEERKMMK